MVTFIRLAYVIFLRFMRFYWREMTSVEANASQLMMLMSVEAVSVDGMLLLQHVGD